MSKGLFVTGTDTEVGKTIVTALLAVALVERGLRVGVMKPAESGCLLENGRLAPQDAQFLKHVSGCAAPLEVINPYTFAPPLTPALAAEHAGVTISLGHIRTCYEQLAENHDVVLVEGAGGLLAPLTATHSMRDLATMLQIPVLVVAANVLGVINHTALTVTVAQQVTSVVGVVLNTPQTRDDLAIETNAESLRRWGGAPLLGNIPHLTTFEPSALKTHSTSIDITMLLESLEFDVGLSPSIQPRS
ncbi:MAG: dethiobiotin synthase [Chloroflexi bacterium AL-W]|nr:dethiobiotin synthase [Chloroflexi bacterium AL-N1]NOK69189.1 dethiobiotin synthase [Chloroflexi bacterium AL-N10]NOK77172.1 dethiobiotin synthase [Chloroflexi bacterium AL-N5]NOK83817.1 dethiobiotin synthase [Chloroflexi bacterium AL-W]NOK91027.1 dethiobiotin synthase [Chloroflexi bacterium AL-N15]